MVSSLVGIYLVCLGVGFVYVLVSIVMGEMSTHPSVSGGDTGGLDPGGSDVGGIDGADVGGVGSIDAGADVGQVGDFGHIGDAGVQHLPLFSPLIVASFLAFFGGMGLAGKLLLELGDATSLILAMPSALVLAAALFLLVAKGLFASSASSEATIKEILGAQAEVLTSLPEGGYGEIAYTCKGFRYTAAARSYDGQPIMRGAKVRIVQTDGRTMTVKEHKS